MAKSGRPYYSSIPSLLLDDDSEIAADPSIVP